MELRRLRYFLAVAGDLHFTRAAERLGIAQASLSEQIRKLEDEVGAPLLTRSSRHVALTPAGRVLQIHAQRVLDHLEHALRSTRLVASGLLGEIRLGAVGSAMTTLVPALLRDLRQHSPQLTVRIQQLSTTAQLLALTEYRIDVGLLRAPVVHPVIRTAEVMREPLTVVLPAGHPMAERQRLTLADLTGETLILWPRAESPGAYDETLELFREAGLGPPQTIEAPDTTSEVALIAAGLGVALQPASFTALGSTAVTVVQLRRPAPTTAVDIAWLPPVEDAALRQVLSTARLLTPTR
ncbi:MAG: LysR family transcriptional regulator [Pseudonocardiales bacterium]|nr:MAG: LysR family transcriptional regulator [Pseudonocardiales bacterium]